MRAIRQKRTRGSVGDNNCGFTLVELMVVVAVIGILVAIAIPQYASSSELAKIRTDMANVRILNGATMQYAVLNDRSGPDIFDGFNSDTDRMAELVESSLIVAIPEPQQSGAIFIWNIDQQLWQNSLLITNEPILSSSRYIFNTLDQNNFRRTGNWSVNDNGFHSNFGLLFIENNREQYTITTKAKLDEGTNGGYGILFETVLNDGNLDSGYVLQFDRGIGRGSIIIRPRVEGAEGNRISSHVFDHSNSFIPDKNTTEGNLWWTQEREIKIEVKKIADIQNSKVMSVWIDDQLLFDDFIFESNVEAVNNFTGFRSWTTGTNYHEMTIE